MKLRFAALSLLALTLATSAALACGPDLPWAVFTHEKHPDVPLAPFAGGQLGVLQPTYARSYLVVAYRYLAGVPLGEAEQRAALRTWKQRSEAWWDAELTGGRWGTGWAAARARVPGLPPVMSELAEIMAYPSAYASADSGTDAVTVAVRTLTERLASEGAGSAALRAWVLAQDTVFACGSAPEWRLADPPSARTDADHLYQLAALAFSQQRYADAEPIFRLLAHAPGARMKPWGAYLAVRCIVRGAQGDDEEAPTIDRAAFERADRELTAILADPQQREAHEAARQLQGFVAFRLRPAGRLGELSRALRASDPRFGRDLWDFVLLLDSPAPSGATMQVLRGSEEALKAAAAADELADWVITFQRGRDAFPHALLRWRMQQSVPWLVAALAAAPSGAREVPELLEAAASMASVSPAFATASSHRARLLAARGDAAGARRVLDAALARPALPVGSRNALLAQRAALASDLPALLADLPRAPAEIVYGGDVGLAPTPLLAWEEAEPDSERTALLARRHRAECFDEGGAALFNRALPLARWLEAAGNAQLPARMRRELALAGWTRAVLLADSVQAVALAAQARELEPALAADLADWERATTREARAFTAALLIARRPGMQPFVNSGLNRLEPFDRLDDYRENWWATREFLSGSEYGLPVGEAATGATRMAELKAPAPAALMLTPAEREAAGAQLARLERIGPAPNWLGDRILAFARTHPNDPRVPEALHRLVRAVRLGESDTRSATLARTAFRLLHARYPASPWTRRTKSWGV